MGAQVGPQIVRERSSSPAESILCHTVDENCTPRDTPRVSQLEEYNFSYPDPIFENEPVDHIESCKSVPENESKNHIESRKSILENESVDLIESRKSIMEDEQENIESRKSIMENESKDLIESRKSILQNEPSHSLEIHPKQSIRKNISKKRSRTTSPKLEDSE